MRREELSWSVFRTEAPWPLLTRLSRLGALCAILSHVERFQPWCSTVVWCEGRTLPKMRSQPGERELPSLRIERDRRTLQWSRRYIVRPLMRCFRLIESQGPLPLPIHDRGIMRLCLLDLVFRLPWETLRRQHVFDPILNGHLDWV